jgi:hypothetical protein
MANAHQSIYRLLELQRNYQGALLQAQYSLDLYRKLDDRTGVARSLNAVGWYRALLGEYENALADCEAALPSPLAGGW